MEGIPPKLWLDWYVSAQVNFTLCLNMLAVIGGNLHVEFESSVPPVVGSGSPFVP